MPSSLAKLTSLGGVSRARIPPGLSPDPEGPIQEWDITFTPSGLIDSINASQFNPDSSPPGNSQADVLDAAGRLVTPSLCHAHIHLDKAFLSSDAHYADLEVKDGDFKEAMEVGRAAKGRFTRDDLEKRGIWLIAESVAAGVTHMRVFVEVDHTVEFKCLDAAIALKEKFRDCCELQICAFAQDPLFSGPHADTNRKLWLQAIQRKEVDVLGTTPYVEAGNEEMFKNLELAVGEARRLGQHLDFHLDYNIDAEQPVVTGWLLDLLKGEEATQMGNLKQITLGHCTRLSLLERKEWEDLAAKVRNVNNQISFIGLPTSDLFIQGRPPSNAGGGERPRGTLQIPHMIQTYGLNGAIAVNNVGNAFTPHGSCDPLALASWCVGVYQTATLKDLQCLFECVSSRARAAIGLPAGGLCVGQSADLVIYGHVSGGEGAQQVPLSKQRPRLELQDLVCDPPRERQVVFNGKLVEI